MSDVVDPASQRPGIITRHGLTYCIDTRISQVFITGRVQRCWHILDNFSPEKIEPSAYRNADTYFYCRAQNSPQPAGSSPAIGLG